MRRYSYNRIPDFTSEGTAGLDIAVLCGDLDTVAHSLRGGDEVDGRGRNDDLYDHAFYRAVKRSEHVAAVLEVYLCSPTLGSREAEFRPFTRLALAASETGLSLKLPPTKNWRAIAIEWVWNGWDTVRVLVRYREEMKERVNRERPAARGRRLMPISIGAVL